MTAPAGVVRVVAGAPAAEDLAALTAVLHAYCAAGPADHTTTGEAGRRKVTAPWTAPPRHRRVSCWPAA